MPPRGLWHRPQKENLLFVLTHQWIIDEFLVFKDWLNLSHAKVETSHKQLLLKLTVVHSVMCHLAMLAPELENYSAKTNEPVRTMRYISPQIGHNSLVDLNRP